MRPSNIPISNASSLRRTIRTVAAPSRYVGLDFLRFVAASLVVLYHYDTFFDLRLDRFGLNVSRLNSMVDFFFILSGFVIATAYAERLRDWSDYRAFLVSRLARVYPLHLLTLLAFLALTALGARLGVKANHPELAKLSGLPATLMLTQAWGFVDHMTFNMPAWSISAEWFVYLLAPMLLALVRRMPLAGALVVALVFALAMGETRAALGMRDWSEATYDFGMLRALPLFFIGLAIAPAISAAPRLGWPRWWMTYAALAAVAVGLQLDIRAELLAALFALTIILAALCEREDRPSWMRSAAAGSLGDASYAIYLLHALVVLPILFVLRKFGWLDSGYAFAGAALTYLAVVAMSFPVYGRFEVPARRRLAAAFGGARRGDAGSELARRVRAVQRAGG